MQQQSALCRGAQRNAPFRVVFALAAQIVNLVVTRMPLAEEFLHILHVVAIQAATGESTVRQAQTRRARCEPLRALAGKAHGDNAIGDVRQIQVEAILSESDLLL